MGAGEWIAVVSLGVTVLLAALGALVYIVRTMERITSRLEAMERRDGEHDARIERLEERVFRVPAIAGA